MIRSLLALTFLLPATALAAPQLDLVRCTDTSLAAGVYGTSYATTYGHTASTVCGGDPLADGLIKVLGSGAIGVQLTAAHAFNFYEVYFVPIGADPVADRVHLGGVLTDCDGNAYSPVRPLTTPASSVSATPANFFSLVGSGEAGSFWLYSRGPYGSVADTTTCMPTVWNTSDSTPSGSFNNPTLWGGASFYDGIQFVSAWGN